MYCFAHRSHLIFFAVHCILFLVLLDVFPIASSWKITKKCPYGHYYNDGCVSCWCDMNTGQTTCQRSATCTRVNVKCPNGKLYKDECGNNCNCYEETGAVYCNNNNPQCNRKVDPMKKEDVENNKSTTMKPATTTQIPKAIPLKNDFEIIQPLVLRRSATIINNQPASGSSNMDYGTADRKQNAFNLYAKIRKLMSKKIKETIQDVINEELAKPLGNMFHQSFSRPVMLENSKPVINYPLEYRRPSISHTPGKATKTVSETIDDEIPTSTSTNIREIVMKPPTNSEATAAPPKMTQPIFNYGRRSENFKEVETIREPLFNSEGSESRKVLTFLRPTSSHQMLSYSGDRMKLHLPNSFSTPASPRPLTYRIPNFPYKAGSDMNFQEQSSRLPSSFTFESSAHRPGSEHVHQYTLRPPVYNIILNSTPRPYLHDNQSYSPKPIIHEFEKSTLQPSYRDHIMYSTPKPAFLESITNSPMPDFQQSTLQPSIYDFQENSRKHSIYGTQRTQQPIRDFQTIHSSTTPSSFVYDFPESAYIKKPLKSNFPQTAPKIPHQYTTNVQNKVPKPTIRLIFQQNTPQPFIFPGYNRIPTIKPANSNYFRTTSITDPSRFTFHQMTTKRPMSIIRVHPNSHRLYQANYNNFNPRFRPTITSISPTMMSTPSVPIRNGKGSQFVYIFHETKPHIYAQKPMNNFSRQPLMQNPTSLINHYIPPPSTNRYPINFARNTPKPIAVPMLTETRKNIVSRPTFDYADTPIRYSSSTPSYFDHLSSTPLANRLEDEIPNPVNLDFQDHTPEQFNFDTNTMPLQQPVSNSNTNYRKPVILKYKNWVSVASTPLPRIVSTTASTTTRRPKIITTQRRPAADIPYTPAASKSTPIIRIHNHGTRTDNIDYSHKIDSDNNPINYFNDPAPSTISSVVNYDYGPEKKTMASSADESEINHEEMIPKELILDPQSGPMRVIFDHDNGQESLKFSDRKGQDGLVTFLQDKPNNPIVVDVDKSLKEPVDVDLGEILVKEPEEEYKPVLVDLEKEQRKTPIIVIKGESGNKNVHRDYIKEENRNNPPENQNETPSYYENYERNQEDKENISDEQVDGDFIAEPSEIVTLQNQDDSYNLRESQDNMGNNGEIISMDQFETSYKNEPVVYADADVNHEEPNTFNEREHTKPQETSLINDYEEQSDTQIEEQIQSQHNSQIESSSPRNVYITNQEQSYYDTSGERDLAMSPVSITPITFDFPHTASTPATFHGDHFDTMYDYDSDTNNFPSNQQQQFAHKSGQEMLSELPLVENKGSILRFKFTKDETISKKPLLVSFKKQGRPPRANGYLKTDAVADVFSFYHKMRQESAKRAAAVAEKKRLEFPSDTTSEVDYYRSKGSRSSTFADNNNETRKVSRGTSDSDGDNDRKRSPVHSTDKVEANTRVDSNERDNARSRSDSSTHNSYKNLGSKLDWKLEIEV